MYRVGKGLCHANIGSLSAAILLAAAVGFPDGAKADEPGEIQLEDETRVPDPDELSHSEIRPLIYMPSRVGAPRIRVGGAIRGSSSQIPRVETLVPEETGTTLTAHPNLYWYLDGKVDHRIDFVLRAEDRITPIDEITLGKGHEPGIHRVTLADRGVTLRPGIEYHWTIAVIPDEEDRSKDFVASGWIVLVIPSGELKAELAAVDREDRQFVLAKAGIWYDALDAVSQQIEASPNAMHLYIQRESLLKQAGLDSGRITSGAAR